MTPRQAGIALAIAHVALVGTLGLRLLADRARLPRGWARTLPYDPSLPIRGRYVRLRIQVPLDSTPRAAARWETGRVSLTAREGRLVGTLDERGPVLVRFDSAGGSLVAAIEPPVPFFIPEHVPDPSLRPAGEELWAEVTVPSNGAPRPIRLGVLRDGRMAPLELR